MAEDKKHWYDGWFYERFIAEHQDELFRRITGLMEPDKDVIDVGCGTGRFSFLAAGKCRSILGIDLSRKNILRAQYSLLKSPLGNVSFMHKSIGEVTDRHFDYAVLTFVIHEVDESERIKLLNEIFGTADRIIIGDYLIPQPHGPIRLVNKAVEFLAGKDHYDNFRNYAAGGGILGLVARGGFKLEAEVKENLSAMHLAVITK
ncbi:MAG TPA: class I SAM-dependent methyltransferase [Ignavibacteriales bacterium]|nr:class I SAM-dependent methyltransferase [Ignavibacteriales bacterium]